TSSRRRKTELGADTTIRRMKRRRLLCSSVDSSLLCRNKSKGSMSKRGEQIYQCIAFSWRVNGVSHQHIANKGAVELRVFALAHKHEARPQHCSQFRQDITLVQSAIRLC